MNRAKRAQLLRVRGHWRKAVTVSGMRGTEETKRFKSMGEMGVELTFVKYLLITCLAFEINILSPLILNILVSTVLNLQKGILRLKKTFWPDTSSCNLAELISKPRSVKIQSQTSSMPRFLQAWTTKFVYRQWNWLLIYLSSYLSFVNV